MSISQQKMHLIHLRVLQHLNIISKSKVSSETESKLLAVNTWKQVTRVQDTVAQNKHPNPKKRNKVIEGRNETETWLKPKRANRSYNSAYNIYTHGVLEIVSWKERVEQSWPFVLDDCSTHRLSVRMVVSISSRFSQQRVHITDISWFLDSPFPL